MAAVDRIRQYFSRKSSRHSSPSAVAAAAEGDSNSNGSSSSRRRGGDSSPLITNTTPSAAPARRRRLQRGWWPDAQRRAQRSFRAMEDLGEQTFVITDEHLEWIFDDEMTDGNNNSEDPQCHLILPSEIATNKTTHKHHHHNNCNTNEGQGKGIRHRTTTSNKCVICMVEYDIGNVIIHSPNCSHAFHQHCILDWFSRENKDCPTCRTIFYDPKKYNVAGDKKTRKASSSSSSSQATNNSNNDGTSTNAGDDKTTETLNNNNNQGRSRSDTADTDALSEFGGDGEQQRSRSRGPSFDIVGDYSNNHGILAAVAEGEAVAVEE
ncbi:hypothetical protein ACHAXR_011141 [Thalassiosira sp. AJA248-18]